MDNQQTKVTLCPLAPYSFAQLARKGIPRNQPKPLSTTEAIDVGITTEGKSLGYIIADSVTAGI